MKKIFFHPGYPKTATTTLQEKVFKSLHNINYVDDFRRKFRSSFFTGDIKGLDYLKSVLSKKFPNIISEENFLIPYNDIFNSNSYGTSGLQFDKILTGFEIPMLLNKNFREFDIEIILTIRKQSDLITPGMIRAKHLKLKVSKIMSLMNPEN